MTSKLGDAQGYLTFGQDDASDVTIKILRINDDHLWIDISDPQRVFKTSDNWTNDDRIEIWWMDQTILDKAGENKNNRAVQRKALRQFAIRMADLNVYPGFGYSVSSKQALPDVERRVAVNLKERQDNEGIRLLVRWPVDQFPSAQGLTLTYAHGNGTATTSAWSTSTLKHAQAQSLSPVLNLQEEGNNPIHSCFINKTGRLNLFVPEIILKNQR
jgi:hypothetical protein